MFCKYLAIVMVKKRRDEHASWGLGDRRQMASKPQLLMYGAWQALLNYPRMVEKSKKNHDRWWENFKYELLREIMKTLA